MVALAAAALGGALRSAAAAAADVRRSAAGFFAVITKTSRDDEHRPTLQSAASLCIWRAVGDRVEGGSPGGTKGHHWQEVWGTSALSCNGMDEGEHATGFQLVECPCVASLTVLIPRVGEADRTERVLARAWRARGRLGGRPGLSKVGCAEICSSEGRARRCAGGRRSTHSAPSRYKRARRR